jgi:hypothetical protein
LHEALLAFTLLEGSHTGHKLAREIFNTLDAYNIADKLFCITTDNASNNGKAMKRLSKLLMRHKGYAWPWEENHVSCLNHVINLTVDAFLKIKGLKDESNVLDTENEEEDDDEEEDEEDDDEEDDMEDDDDDDEDMIDTTSQNPIALSFGRVLKRIHEIMKVPPCNIHPEHININMNDLYATIFFL